MEVHELNEAVDGVMTAFEEFKATNEQRLAELEKKGGADPLLDDKLAKIDESINKYEGVNKKFTEELTEARQKALDAEEKAKALEERADDLETKLNRIPAGSGNSVDPEEFKKRINTWARGVVLAQTKGEPNLADEQREILAAVREEYKALSISDDTTGGYLAPMEYVREIIKGVTEISPVRQLARVRTTAQKGIQVPKRTGQFAARRTAEHGSRTETPGLTYGMEEITAPEMYALIDISEQNLEDSAFDMEAEIRMEATEQFAVLEGQEFVTGNGVGEIEGVLSASAGVSTTNSGSATTVADVAGQADGLITLKHAIKTPYTRNAMWSLNRTTLGSVRKLKTGDNQYLWMPGIAMGKPNTIDGDPYVETPDMPNEGAGNKPIVYGDFMRACTIVDRISMSMLRDPYTQATSGNIRFLFRRRTGGQVVLSEAIRALVCAAG